MRILVLGYIVRGPLGGMAWHHLQYVLGLKAMGHDILFLEDSDDYPSCYDPTTSLTTCNPEYGLNFIQKVFQQTGLNDQWAYFDAHSNNWFGWEKIKVLDFCHSADIVLNISGVNPLRNWWMNIPVRLLIDTDPGFTQIRILNDKTAFELACAHNRFYSFAENIGNASCRIPADGIDWKPTRQPIYLPAWKISDPTPSGKWTTVMQWDSYPPKEYQGQLFGMKSMSFQDYLSLPRQLPDEIFELALGGAHAPADELNKQGWQLVSSLIPTETITTYQQYLQSSKAEWSIAKHGYVVANSGWFSERSACYMASGKPVLLQDTGFSAYLPTGKGLLCFSSPETAIENIHRINKDYRLHCRAAREIAESYFSHNNVLGDLLNGLVG